MEIKLWLTKQFCPLVVMSIETKIKNIGLTSLQVLLEKYLCEMLKNKEVESSIGFQTEILMLFKKNA